MVLSNCNLDKHKTQMEYLSSELLYGTNNYYFKVINPECGTGKTLTAETTFALNGISPNNKVLFVRQFIKDCIGSANRLNEQAGNIKAFALNTNTVTKHEWNEKVKHEIENYDVLFITHEKYKALINDPISKKIITNGRGILVIDEFLNMAKDNELIINLEMINDFKNLLYYDALQDLYREITAEIKDYLLLTRPKNTFFNATTKPKVIERKVNKLTQLIKTNLTVDYLQKHEYTMKGIIRKLHEIKQFYNQTCVCEFKNLYCTDRTQQYWLLPNNNIILDASGDLNMSYRLNPIFILQKQARVLNHKNWTINIVPANSTKSKKNKSTNYYEIVNHAIDSLDDPLVVGNKEEWNQTKFSGNHVDYFGNLVGSNKYMDLKDFVIAHTPNLPYRQYVLEYLYYSGKKFGNGSSWNCVIEGSGDFKVYRFANKDIEQYRQRHNANEIYQAIKRVNRSMQYQTNGYIFNNDKQVLNLVLKMLKHCKFIEHYNPIEYTTAKDTRLKQINEDKKNNRLALKLINLLQEIRQSKHLTLQKKDGVYPKQTLREYLDIQSKSQFSKLTKDSDIIDFCKRHNISGIDRGQTLDFRQCV